MTSSEPPVAEQDSYVMSSQDFDDYLYADILSRVDRVARTVNPGDLDSAKLTAARILDQVFPRKSNTLFVDEVDLVSPYD